MKNFKLISVLTLLLLVFSGFGFGETDQERRTKRIAQNKDALELLYKEEPSTKEAIKKAYGYATFKSYGMNMFVMSVEGGEGLVHNNTTGKITYMNVTTGGMGMGLGAKEFIAVFIFDNKKVFDYFIDKGLEVNAQAEVVAKAEEDGDGVNKVHTLKDGVKLYKLTKNGLSMQMTLQGSKYWKCRDLN